MRVDTEHPADVTRRTVPCGANPDAWWHPATYGYAMHQCLHHCPALAWCRDHGHRGSGSVTAGVLYEGHGDSGLNPQPAVRQPAEVSCADAPTVEVPVPLCPVCGGRMPEEGQWRYCKPECSRIAQVTARRASERRCRERARAQREALKAGVPV